MNAGASGQINSRNSFMTFMTSSTVRSVYLVLFKVQHIFNFFFSDLQSLYLNVPEPFPLLRETLCSAASTVSLPLHVLEALCFPTVFVSVFVCGRNK